MLIVDGLQGEIHINPSTEVLAEYKEKQQQFEAEKAELAKLVNEKSVSAEWPSSRACGKYRYTGGS